jgi:hypothetical protein
MVSECDIVPDFDMPDFDIMLELDMPGCDMVLEFDMPVCDIILEFDACAESAIMPCIALVLADWVAGAGWAGVELFVAAPAPSPACTVLVPAKARHNVQTRVQLGFIF